MKDKKKKTTHAKSKWEKEMKNHKHVDPIHRWGLEQYSCLSKWPIDIGYRDASKWQRESVDESS